MVIKEGTVTNQPVKTFRTWCIRMRLDSGILMEFEMIGATCDIHVNERIRIIFSPAPYEGDLPHADEIYSITRQKKVFPRGLLG
jgi:hypothetical protein